MFTRLVVVVTHCLRQEYCVQTSSNYYTTGYANDISLILYIKLRFGSGISTNIRDTLAKKVLAIQFHDTVPPSTYGHHV